MNKYKEALEHIKAFRGYTLLTNLTQKDFETLQELIDNYGDYMSYQDLKAEYELKIANLEKQIGTDEEIFGGK